MHVVFGPKLWAAVLLLAYSAFQYTVIWGKKKKKCGIQYRKTPVVWIQINSLEMRKY